MKKIIFAALLFCITMAYAQDPFVPTGENFSLNVTIPNAPEAAALTEFGKYDASLYTGTPNIAIPIGSISAREFTIPMALNYDASGVKVSQLASWVGLGWNLQAGGVVNRINVGKPDDMNVARIDYKPFYNSTVKSLMDRFPHQLNKLDIIPEGDITDYFDFKDRVNKGEYETQPDYYTFSAPGGLQGKFFIDYENEVGVCLNDETIKIIPTITPTIEGYKILSSFVIIDNRGTRYDFNLAMENRSWFTTVIAVGGGSEEVDDFNNFNSSWLLTKITTGISKEEILFEYHTKTAWKNPQRFGLRESTKNCIGANGPEAYCNPTFDFPMQTSKYREYKIDQVLLKEIKINNVIRASFTLNTTPREDLEDGKSLDKVDIFNNQGDLISSTSLSTSYFQNGSGQSEASKRLKLDDITQVSYGSIPGTSETQKHTFEYDGDGDIPSRHSLAQDWWGYYNNKTINDTKNTMVPRIETDFYTLDGAYRDPNIAFATLGTLTKITYPTGGYTTFDYGMHQIGYETDDTTTWTDITLEPFQGGLLDPSDPNSNPYGLIDDSCPGIPKGIDNTFSVNTPNNEKVFRVLLDFEDDNTPEPCQHWSVLVIYPTTNNAPNIEEFKNDPSTRYFYQEMIGTLGEFEVELPNGSYKYLIMNNSDKYTYVLQKADDSNYVPHAIYGGGLRIDKVRSYSETSDLITYKRYYYDDYTNAPSNLSDDDFKEASSAILQEPLRFTELMYENKRDTPQNGLSCELYNKDYTYMYRYANNRNIQAENTVTYTVVTELNYAVQPGGDPIKGYTVQQFYNSLKHFEDYPYPDDSILNGQLRKMRSYDQGKNLKREEETTYNSLYTQKYAEGTSFLLNAILDGSYSVFASNTSGHEYYDYFQSEVFFNIDGECDKIVCSQQNEVDCISEGTALKRHDKINFIMETYWQYPTKRKVRDYFDGDFIETVTDYFHDNASHRQVTRTEEHNSKGDLLKGTYTYPQDIASPPSEISTLITQNRLTELVKKKGEINGNISETEMTFTTHNGIVLPLEVIITKQNDLTSNMMYDQYDDHGNILQTSRRAGSNGNILAEKTAFVWGYNHTLPVAKIENLTYAQLFSGIPIVNLSLLNGSPTDQQVRDEIDKIRQAFPEALVTTYTYKPDIGVTSITGPNNQTQYFEYDAPGRLVNVRDIDANLVGSYEYNYKSNN